MGRARGNVVEEANRSKRVLSRRTDCSEASFNDRNKDFREIHANLLSTIKDSLGSNCLRILRLYTSAWKRDFRRSVVLGQINY